MKTNRVTAAPGTTSPAPTRRANVDFPRSTQHTPRTHGRAPNTPACTRGEANPNTLAFAKTTTPIYNADRPQTCSANPNTAGPCTQKPTTTTSNETCTHTSNSNHSSKSPNMNPASSFSTKDKKTKHSCSCPAQNATKCHATSNQTPNKIHFTYLRTRNTLQT